VFHSAVGGLWAVSLGSVGFDIIIDYDFRLGVEGFHEFRSFPVSRTLSLPKVLFFILFARKSRAK
jgi:hypothetical protein